MPPTFDVAAIVLALVSSFFSLAVGVAVLIIALVQWPHTRRYLREGATLALLTFVAGLPLLALSVMHLDLPRSFQTLGPRFAYLAAAFGGFAAVIIALLSLAHSCLKVPVALLADPERCPFPLLLGKERRFGGWAVAAACGVVTGVASAALFLYMDVSVSPMMNALQAFTPHLNRGSLAYQLGALLPGFVGIALAEEVVYRGLVQPWLARLLGGTTPALASSVVVTSALWAIGHSLNTDHMAVKLVQIFVIGLLFGAIARRYSVEASMVSHALLNVVAITMPLALTGLGLYTPPPEPPVSVAAAPQEAGKPIPTAAESPTISLDEPARVAWTRRNLLEAYDRVGIRNPRWDAPVRRFIEDATPELIDVHHGPRVWANDLAGRGREILSKGCTDPLFLYLQARSLAFANGDSLESRLLLERAVEGMKTVSYPRAVARYVASGLFAYYQSAGGGFAAPGGLAPLELQWFTESLSDGSYRPDESPVLLWQLTNGTGVSFFARNKWAASTAIEGSPWIERWVKLHFSGVMHYEMAWEARGHGWAKDVGPEQWRKFELQMGLARTDLTRAWSLRPDRPEAAYEMVSVAQEASDPGESGRTWFDRTVAARMDYWPAYTSRLNRLLPRWGGSYEEMLDFGEECLNTGRFDTYVPSILIQAVRNIESDERDNLGEDGGEVTIHSNPRTFPLVARVLDGYLKEPSRVWERMRWLSLYAVYADKAGQHATALSKLKSAGMELDSDSFWRTQESPRLFVSRVSVLGGPGGAEGVQAERFIGNFETENALTALGEAMRRDPGPQSAFYFKNRVTSLTLERDLESGAWLPFMPKDTDLSGWEVREGRWARESDGGLTATAGPHGTIIVSLARVGPDFEVRGAVEKVSSTNGAYQSGVLFGHPYLGWLHWTSFRLHDNSRTGTAARLSKSFSIQAPALAFPAAARDEFLVRSWRGLLTAVVNGKTVVSSSRPPDGFVKNRDALVGFGAYHDDNESVVRYRNLEIRKLKAPPAPLP